jgi:tetratricopeptide (TPR) repeat protein
MDDLDALLERGWKLLDDGDLAAAAAAAERAVGQAPHAAEAHSLAGAVAAANGDNDRALAAFKRAMKLDESWAEPALLAAQLVAADGNLEEALALCERALDAAEEEDEYADALLCKAELQIALEDEDGARATLGELPPVALPDSALETRAADAFMELGDLEAAERHYRSALALDPDEADAHYGLGVLAFEKDEADEAVRRFQKVRELDLASPPVPWAITQEALEARVEAALEELPERAKKLLGNVPVIVEDYPSPELIADGIDPRLLGLFVGLPYPEQGMGAPPDLQRILLFKRNIERDARTADEVEEQIRITILHETGHFFGLEEEELEALGLD